MRRLCNPVFLLLLSNFFILFAAADRLAALATVTCASPAVAKPQATEYFVSVADRDKHLAHVSIRMPQGSGVRTLNMPVWNALYQVRNFAANVENVRAQDAAGNAAEVYHL